MNEVKYENMIQRGEEKLLQTELVKKLTITGLAPTKDGCIATMKNGSLDLKPLALLRALAF